MNLDPASGGSTGRPPRVAVLLNPISGRGLSRRIYSEVAPTLASHGLPSEVFETRHAHHGEEIVRELNLSEFGALIALGGDGTVHDVLNGMLTRPDGRTLPIGVIPAGAGNALAWDLGMADPKSAAQRITRFQTRSVDVAEVRIGQRTRFALNIVGWGLAADINRLADRMRMLGRHRYIVAAILEVLRLKRPIASLRVNGNASEEVLVFALGSLTRYTGAGMKIAPEAVLDDGLIDLLLVRNPSRLEILKVLPKVFSGDHMGHPELEYRKVGEFSIFSETPGVLNLDGETYPERNCSVRVIPRRIEILI